MSDIHELRQAYNWYALLKERLGRLAEEGSRIAIDRASEEAQEAELDLLDKAIVALPALFSEADEAARLREENNSLRAMLRTIALQDATKIARDPDLPRRVALAALQWRDDNA